MAPERKAFHRGSDPTERTNDWCKPGPRPAAWPAEITPGNSRQLRRDIKVTNSSVGNLTRGPKPSCRKKTTAAGVTGLRHACFFATNRSCQVSKFFAKVAAWIDYNFGFSGEPPTLTYYIPIH